MHLNIFLLTNINIKKVYYIARIEKWSKYYDQKLSEELKILIDYFNSMLKSKSIVCFYVLYIVCFYGLYICCPPILM